MRAPRWGAANFPISPTSHFLTLIHFLGHVSNRWFHDQIKESLGRERKGCGTNASLNHAAQFECP